MYTHFFLTMVLSNAILESYQFITINGHYDAISASWKHQVSPTKVRDRRRIMSNIMLEYTEYFFKTSNSEIIPVKCYTRIERISNNTTSTMCRSLESHQEICLECHYNSYDKKFVRHHDEVGKYVKMAIPPTGFVCMPREIAAGCDVEKIGRYVEMDVFW